MTECVYAMPVASFASSANLRAAPCFAVPVLAEGRAALEAVNEDMGLGFDDQVMASWRPMRRTGALTKEAAPDPAPFSLPGSFRTWSFTWTCS